MVSHVDPMPDLTVLMQIQVQRVPENVNILSGVNNNRSRPVTPVSVVNNNRSHSPSNPIDPNKASVHSHPNCKCDVGSAKKVDNAQTQTKFSKKGELQLPQLANINKTLFHGTNKVIACWSCCCQPEK